MKKLFAILFVIFGMFSQYCYAASTSAQAYSATIDTMLAGCTSGQFWTGTACATPAGGGGGATLPNYYLADYGAVCDGAHAAADTSALTTVMGLMQTSSLDRGGVLHFQGHCNFTTNMAWVAYAASTLHSIYLEGDGPIQTVFDFGSTTGDLVSFDSGSHYGIRNLEIYGTTSGACLRLNGANHGVEYNLRLQGCAQGRYASNTYGIVSDRLWAKDNSSVACKWDGFNTTQDFRNTFCTGSSAQGVDMNGVTGSHFSTLTMDGVSGYGGAFSNITSTVFDAPYCESLTKGCMKVVTSNAVSTGLPAGVQDIHGVVINGLVSYFASTSSAGTYGSFLELASNDNRPIEITFNGAHGTPNAAGDRAFVISSNGGTIRLNKQLMNVSQFSTADSISASGGANIAVSEPDGPPISWTPTHTGFSANPTVTATYRRNGRQCTIYYNCTANGTSNSANYTITNLPCIASGKSFGYIVGTNAGVQVAATAETTSGSATLTLTNGAKTGGGLWTASGNKCALFSMTYEAQ